MLQKEIIMGNNKIAFKIVAESDAFTIFRDAEPLKTPRNLPVTVPTKKLAEAIVEECVGQGDRLDLRRMPLTQMALTAIDIAANHRDEVINGIMKFGDSELVCQRATDPADLVARQNEGWQPYLYWCKDKFGAELLTGSGIVPFKQSEEALTKLGAVVESYGAFALTGLSEAVSILGSLVLGLALATKHVTADEAFAAAELDHLWQNKKWGDDPETQSQQAEIKDELTMCARYFELLG